MRATVKIRARGFRLTVWPQSLPWLLERGDSQWWILDRAARRLWWRSR